MGDLGCKSKPTKILGVCQDDSSWSSSDERSVSSDLEDLGFEDEEAQESCLTDLAGNRILLVGNVAKSFREAVCCQRSVKNHKKHILAFLVFCKEEEERVASKERV